VLAEDGLDMPLSVAICGMLEETLDLLRDDVLLFIDGVPFFLLCCP